MRLALCLAFVVLTGCASLEQRAKVPEPPSMARMMAEADVAIAAGDVERASKVFAAAAATYPAEVAPWSRLTRLSFERGNYAAAIRHAQEVIVRAPDDSFAHSVIAASGLRLASAALAELGRTNGVSGDLRTEAKSLAKLLRANLGTRELVPVMRQDKVRTESQPLLTEQQSLRPEADNVFDELLGRKSAPAPVMSVRPR